VIPALASSRDGINFTRVAGGAPTLPLGPPGSWDSGRISLRNPPHLVDGVWRQYYTGSSWKHGFGGMGKRPHPSVPEAALASPMQLGLAEMPAGHWTHLQVSRESEAGELVTVPLRLERPHALTLDLEGGAAPGGAVSCALFEPATRAPHAGHDFVACDPIASSGRDVPVTWRGKGMDSLAARSVQLGVRVLDRRTKLFGLNLIPG
jgi:hypothetical protein